MKEPINSLTATPTGKKLRVERSRRTFPLDENAENPPVVTIMLPSVNFAGDSFFKW
jgi:hypothetical protein